jgi:hypothetical protein
MSRRTASAVPAARGLRGSGGEVEGARVWGSRSAREDRRARSPPPLRPWPPPGARSGPPALGAGTVGCFPAGRPFPEGGLGPGVKEAGRMGRRPAVAWPDRRPQAGSAPDRPWLCAGYPAAAWDLDFIAGQRSDCRFTVDCPDPSARPAGPAPPLHHSESAAVILARCTGGGPARREQHGVPPRQRPGGGRRHSAQGGPGRPHVCPRPCSPKRRNLPHAVAPGITGRLGNPTRGDRASRRGLPAGGGWVGGGAQFVK